MLYTISPELDLPITKSLYYDQHLPFPTYPTAPGQPPFQSVSVS